MDHRLEDLDYVEAMVDTYITYLEESKTPEECQEHRRTLARALREYEYLDEIIPYQWPVRAEWYRFMDVFHARMWQVEPIEESRWEQVFEDSVDRM